MNYKEAVTLLKPMVKHSDIENQKHIDLSLALASQRSSYQEALLVIKNEIKSGSVTENEFKKSVGLI
jgi:hypothetical protein